MTNEDVPRDTAAWRVQVWVSFLCAGTSTAWGISMMPVDAWVRGYMGMGVIFLVGATFTLAKTLRDDHEAKRFRNKLNAAKTDRIMRDFEVSDAVGGLR